MVPMADIDATILDAIAIPDLWQPWFKNPATWSTWLCPASRAIRWGSS
jgi:hypothetical protein